MASAAPLKDIDKQFLQCCICLDQLKEPKILQCLHRHCRDCLKKIIKEGAKKVQCPTCRDEHTLPEGGVDGLKTDFNTKNIVEFIQLQESVQQDPLKECAGCEQKLKVSAYCFRCNDFLCQDCHQYHTTSKIVKDHRDHVFSLSDAGARNLTIEKLSSLKDSPRCNSHPEKLSELVCTSCDNLPVCVPCTYGAHKGHELQEVASLAKVERGKLKAKVADLEQYKGKILKMQEDIEKAKEEMRQTLHEKRGQLEEQLNGEEETFKRKIRDTDQKLKKKTAELQEKTRQKTMTQKQELEKELAEARARYDKFCEEERQEADAGFKKLQQESESEKVKLQDELDAMNRRIREILAALRTQEEENTKKINDSSDHYDGIMKRFKTVTTTASSILAAKHDWTDVQCIPDVYRAIDSLIKEVQRELPELGALADVNIRGMVASGRKGKVTISEKPESVVDIKGIKIGRVMRGFTSNGDSNIFITGGSIYESHIIVTNRRGEQQKQCTIRKRIGNSGHCDLLSDNEVVVVVDGREMGIYNITNNVYTGRDISDRVPWPPGQCIRSVAVDHENRHIIVACSRREVYVFNSELGYIKTLMLPEELGGSIAMTVHGTNLLICDLHRRRAYAVTMEEPMCKMWYEFPSPGSNSIPHSVCTDSNHFIYIVWSPGWWGRSMVVQYSPDWKQSAKRSLDDSAGCITTVNTCEGEKLVIATQSTGELITYRLE